MSGFRSRYGHTNGSGIAMSIVPGPRLVAVHPGHGSGPPPGYRDTLREHMVFIRKSAAAGMSARKIAEQLGCAPGTVANFIRRHRLVNNSRRGARW